MTLNIVEQEIHGPESNIPELVRRCHARIFETLGELSGGSEPEWEWEGKLLSGAGRGEVVVAHGSLVATHEVDGRKSTWVVVKNESDIHDGHTIHRMLISEDGESVMQELEPPEQVDDLAGKYERDRLLDVLQGCLRDQPGTDPNAFLKF